MLYRPILPFIIEFSGFTHSHLVMSVPLGHRAHRGALWHYGAALWLVSEQKGPVFPGHCVHPTTSTGGVNKGEQLLLARLNSPAIISANPGQSAPQLRHHPHPDLAITATEKVQLFTSFQTVNTERNNNPILLSGLSGIFK